MRFRERVFATTRTHSPATQAAIWYRGLEILVPVEGISLPLCFSIDEFIVVPQSSHRRERDYRLDHVLDRRLGREVPSRNVRREPVCHLADL